MMNPHKLHQTKHLAKGEKKYKNKGPKSKSKAQKPKGDKRTNYVLEGPLVVRSILEKEREGKLESVISLEDSCLQR